MILLVVFGALMLILSAFYLVNSWQQYRQWLIPTIMVVLSLAAVICGTINLPYWHHDQATVTRQSSASSSAKSSTTTQSSANSISGIHTVFSQQNTAATQEQKEMYLLRQLQKAYGKLGTVSYDSDTKTYQITVTDDNTVKALNYVLQDPSQAKQVGWTNMTKSLDQTSRQMKKVVGSGYSLSMMKPGDDKTAIYTVKDGQTTYDEINQ